LWESRISFIELKRAPIRRVLREESLGATMQNPFQDFYRETPFYFFFSAGLGTGLTSITMGGEND